MANTTEIGHNIVIEIDDETSAAINISGNANLVELTRSFRTGTYKNFGDGWDYANDGGKGWKAKFRIYFSVATSESYIDILESWVSTRGPRTLSTYWPDNTPGSRQYSGDAILDGDITLTGDRNSDDVITVEFEVLGHGALTPTTVV